LAADFRETKITEIVIPEFEAALEMTRQALTHLKVPAAEIQRATEASRDALLGARDSAARDFTLIRHLQAAEGAFALRWVQLSAASTLVNLTIKEAGVRSQTGASIVAVLRRGELNTNPDPAFRLQAEDLVAVIGTDAARQQFQALAN
jgi:CPA2 family monovalent cation:H+ antiporter-2